MENYKIIQVLKTFDRKELRNFREFVLSPYFNKNEPVKKLFEALEKHYPEFSNRNLTIENIFKKVFPAGKYDYHKINNVISDLYKLSEKFLWQLGIEKSEYSQQRAMIPEFRLRKLYKIYEQKFTTYIKELLDRPVKDEDYFYYLYEMNDDYMYYTTVKQPKRDMNMLQREFDNFFSFSLIRLLKFYSLMLHEQIGHNVEYNFTMMEEIISFLKSYNHGSSATLQVFSNILLLLHTKDKKYYDELKILKLKYMDELKRPDQYLLFMHLYDYCGYAVNYKEDESYFMDMFEILREWVERGFMTTGEFHYQELINIVKIACTVKEFEYAENILKEYYPHVPAEFKEDVNNYCLGNIEYGKGELNKALVFFSKSNFLHFIFKVQVKLMLLKIYYHLGMNEQALAMIDTFRHFVSREINLPAEHRESYSKFLGLMTELIKINESVDAPEGFKVKNMLEGAVSMPSNPFGIKVWISNTLKNLHCS